MSLVDLGVSLQEVNALVNATSLGGVPEWMALYLKGFSFATSNKYSRAIQVYKQLESQTLKDSVKVLCSLGEACWRTGDCMNAVQYYQRVRRIDPACLTGMDIYSQILADESRHVELEKYVLIFFISLGWSSFECTRDSKQNYFLNIYRDLD